jgi:hypothetical protein
MAQTHEYKLIIGSVKQPINEQLKREGQQGWKPILMSTPLDGPNGSAHVYVILEHPIGG